MVVFLYMAGNTTRDGNFVPGGSVGIFEQLDLVDANPLTVAIVDSAGDQISSFGGGTQYADGVARGTATGTLAMGDDGTNIQSIHTDSSGDLQVDVLTMPTVGVTQSTSPWVVGGDVASAATDSGNPVKIGGKFNNTQPTFTDGQRGDLQLDSRGQLIVATGINGVGVFPSSPGSSDGYTTNMFKAGPALFNGTNYDRGRSIINSTNSTGTGIQAVGNLAQFDDVSPTSITENQFGNLRMSANRNAYQTIRDAAGNERGANVTASNELLVNVSTFSPGTAATSIGKAEDAAHASGDTGIAIWGVRNDANNARSDTDGDYTPISTDSEGSVRILGNRAHDSADSGRPIKIGTIAYSPDGTTPGTAVAELDRSDSKSDLDGRLFVNDEHPRFWSYHENSSSALTDTTVQSSPGAGFQTVITDIIVSTGAATALNFFLEEGASKIWGPIYLEAVAGRGFVWKGKKHVTAATAVTITTSAAIAHSIEILGYIQAV